MTISSVSQFLTGAAVADVGSLTRQKSPTPSALASIREEIREKGLSAWAHEQKMETLKARLRPQILEQKDLSEAAIGAMPPDQQVSVEAEIEKLIADKLQDAMKAAMEEAAETGKSTAILIDIAV